MSTHILPEAFTQPQPCSQPPKEVQLDVLKMAVWQRKRTGADLMGLVHHLRPWGAVQVYSLRAGPVRLRGGRLGGVEGGPPFGFALAEALNSLYKAELIRNQGP